MNISSDSMMRVSQMINNVAPQDDVSMAVMKIAQDQTKQDGENAIQLIKSVPDGSLGHHFDARA